MIVNGQGWDQQLDVRVISRPLAIVTKHRIIFTCSALKLPKVGGILVAMTLQKGISFQRKSKTLWEGSKPLHASCSDVLSSFVSRKNKNKWLPKQNMSFCCQWKEVGLYGVPGSTQTKVFTAFDALEPTITCPLSGACHWFTPEMYQEHGDATSWEARGNVSAEPTAGNLSSAKKNCLKWCFCQAVKGKTRRKTEQRLQGKRVFSSFVKEEKTFEDENAARLLTRECVQLWMHVFEE